MAIFKENLTSKILQEISSKIINNSKRNLSILEVGCGDGNITKHLITKRKIDHVFHLSDISKKAVNVCKNSIKYKSCSYKYGKWLLPWKNKTFDVIISDVSSINDAVAKNSPWYRGVICNAGDDGLKNVKKILKDIKGNLKPNGIFILPIISLSNEKKLLKDLKKDFINVSYTKKINWPIHNFFKKKLPTYEKLKKRGQINYLDKFGVKIAYTYSAICKKPK